VTDSTFSNLPPWPRISSCKSINYKGFGTRFFATKTFRLVCRIHSLCFDVLLSSFLYCTEHTAASSVEVGLENILRGLFTRERLVWPPQQPSLFLTSDRRGWIYPSTIIPKPRSRRPRFQFNRQISFDHYKSVQQFLLPSWWIITVLKGQLKSPHNQTCH